MGHSSGRSYGLPAAFGYSGTTGDPSAELLGIVLFCMSIVGAEADAAQATGRAIPFKDCSARSSLTNENNPLQPRISDFITQIQFKHLNWIQNMSLCKPVTLIVWQYHGFLHSIEWL